MQVLFKCLKVLKFVFIVFLDVYFIVIVDFEIWKLTWHSA